jgi:hypothetical protein
MFVCCTAIAMLFQPALVAENLLYVVSMLLDHSLACSVSCKLTTLTPLSPNVRVQVARKPPGFGFVEFQEPHHAR